MFEEDPYSEEEILYTAKTHVFNPNEYFADNIMSHQRKAKRKTAAETQPVLLPEPVVEPTAHPPTTSPRPPAPEPTEHRQYNTNRRQERMNARQQEGKDNTDSVPEAETAATFCITNDREDLYEGLTPYEIAVTEMLLGNATFLENVNLLICQPITPQETALQMSLDQLLNQGPRGEAAAIKEVQQLLNRNTFHPLRWQDLTQNQRRHALRCHGVGDEKRNGTLKARAVANGNQQDKSKYPNLTSPTASHMTTMIHMAVVFVSVNTHAHRFKLQKVRE